ncbi:hypothetical protein DFJ74DRAFT_771264 [Hyaloraphidium curvatum]|nr:hypothetical protein DFJ74DRAFT_771264 [Hyaloraphidium curvatum]
MQSEAAPTANGRYKVRPAGSTWGDFGADDQLGRLNLVTPEKVLEGIKEVKTGKTFCLSLPLDLPGGTRFPMRPPPVLSPTVFPTGKPFFNAPVSLMGWPKDAVDVVCDDRVMLTLQYSTQWDTLAHVGAMFDVNGDGKPVVCYYNGYQGDKDILGPVTYAPDGSGDVVKEHPTFGGAKKLGVENMAEHVVQGRGVLFDVHRHYGPGKVVGWKEVKEMMEKDGIDVRKGDFVLFHHGCGQVLVDKKGDLTDEEFALVNAGLDGRDKELHKWITNSGLVALISDTIGVEAMYSDPPPDANGPYAFMGIHNLALFRLGVYLGEFFYLTPLAEYLAANKRTAFLFTAPPLRLPGAVGSPAQGIATC